MDQPPKFKSPEEPISEEAMEVMSRAGSIAVIIPRKIWEASVPLIGIPPAVARGSSPTEGAKRALDIYKLLAPTQKQL